MKNRKLTQYIPELLIVSIFLILISPTLFSEGMFMDGLIYAVVSRNMAIGVGSFWMPQFSDTIFFHFYEHPPLQFGLQAVLFKILGDNILVERLYSLATGLTALFLIRKLWIIETKSVKFSWLPMIVWVIIPLVWWTYSNNMLENTMTVMVLFSLIFSTLSKSKNRILYILLSALSLFAAFLTKGFTGLFPFGYFFFSWLILKDISFKRFLSDTTMLIFAFLILNILTFGLYEPAKSFITHYFDIQVVNSLKSVQTVSTRFAILGWLLNNILPHVALIAVLFFITKIKKKSIPITKATLRNFLFWAAIGLSGTIPMMISLKQRDFYLVSTLPAYSVMFAYLLLPFLSNVNLKFNTKKILKITTLVFVIAGIFMPIYFSGKINRDKVMVSDIKTICNQLPEKTKCNICPDLKSNWSLYAYFQRYGKISLEISNENTWYISDNMCFTADKFEKQDNGNLKYKLYKKTE